MNNWKEFEMNSFNIPVSLNFLEQHPDIQTLLEAAVKALDHVKDVEAKNGLLLALQTFCFVQAPVTLHTTTLMVALEDAKKLNVNLSITEIMKLVCDGMPTALNTRVNDVIAML